MGGFSLQIWTTTPAVCVWRGGSGGGALKKIATFYVGEENRRGAEGKCHYFFLEGGHVEFLIEFPAS